MIMDCRKVRELLNAYIDRELSEMENRLVEVHLEMCQSCRHESAAYQATSDFMRAHGRVASPPDLAENIRIIMEKESLIPTRKPIMGGAFGKRKFSLPPLRRVHYLAMAASLIFVLLTSGGYYIFDAARNRNILETTRTAAPAVSAGITKEKTDTTASKSEATLSLSAQESGQPAAPKARAFAQPPENEARADSLAESNSPEKAVDQLIAAAPVRNKSNPKSAIPGAGGSPRSQGQSSEPRAIQRARAAVTDYPRFPNPPQLCATPRFPPCRV